MGKNKRTEIISFSYLRVIACIGIIFLHLFYSGVYLFGPNIKNNQYLSSYMCINNLMWAVPIFIMVTGALLLDPERNITYEKIFKKYILRVLSALIIFIFVYRIFDLVMNKEAFTVMGIVNGIIQIIQGTSWAHLWYLYLLIGLYLLLPFYRMISKASSKHDMRYLLGIYAIFLSIIPILNAFGLNSAFYIHVSTIYPFYLFLGHAIHSKQIHLSKVASILLFIVMSVTIAILTYFRVAHKIVQLDSFWAYSSILVILQAFGLFSFVDQLNIKKNVVTQLDACSFGIYLLHMIFIRLILKHMLISPYSIPFGYGIMTIGILVISFVLTYILKKIPLIKNIL